MIEKLCLWCEHFELDTGSHGYSDWTPGSEFEMKCGKKHWSFDTGDSEDHYHACLISARNCPDYKFKEELVQIKPAYEGE